MLQPSVQVSDQDGVLVAEFWDCLRLDPAPVQELRKAYESLQGPARRPDLIVDFLGVDFAGSAALGGFVQLQRLCRQHGGRLVLCNLCPTVFEVFRLTKLVPLFTFVPDRSAAVALLRVGPVHPDVPTTVTPDLPAEYKAPDELGRGVPPRSAPRTP
jgi:anti-anti-sigma factor